MKAGVDFYYYVTFNGVDHEVNKRLFMDDLIDEKLKARGNVFYTEDAAHEEIYKIEIDRINKAGAGHWVGVV
jgi:hypothetical protein